VFSKRIMIFFGAFIFFPNFRNVGSVGPAQQLLKLVPPYITFHYKTTHKPKVSVIGYTNLVWWVVIYVVLNTGIWLTRIHLFSHQYQHHSIKYQFILSYGSHA